MNKTMKGDVNETVTRPLLFISHRHADQAIAIADVLRKFVTDRSGGRIKVYQSSSAYAEGPQAGIELYRQLKERLWAAGVVVLVYTSPEEDWSTCMWECGCASHPKSPETKVVVLQCGPQSPSVYGESVRVNAKDLVDIQKFTSDFLTSSDFFPGHGEAVTEFDKNGDQVRQAARELHDAMIELIPPELAEDWPTVPFLRLQLTYTEVDAIRQLGNAEGSRSVQESARVIDIDGEAKRIFGLAHIQQSAPFAPFSRLVEAWQQGLPDEPTKWVEELCEQIRVGSHWRRPRFGWELMRSVDQADRTKYSPVLSRVRSVPWQRYHQFDIYFSKFDTDEEGAVKIGFVHERQAGPD